MIIVYFFIKFILPPLEIDPYTIGFIIYSSASTNKGSILSLGIFIKAPVNKSNTSVSGVISSSSFYII